MPSKSLSVVLPVYNEEGNVERVISRISGFLPSIAADFEIIAVDDGSRDKTPEILERLKKGQGHLRVIRHNRNLGYGAALISGFVKAQKELILMMDADQQFDIADILRLTPFIEEHDLVVGSRPHRSDPFYRAFYSYWFNALARLIFRIKLKDINCGFKLFKREVLQGMELFSTGSLISAEILVKTEARLLKIKQVDVPHYPRVFGRQTGSSPRVIWTILCEMYKLKWRLRAGRR